MTLTIRTPPEVSLPSGCLSVTRPIARTAASDGSATLADMTDFESVIGLECHVELDDDEDVLRLPQRVRGAAELERLPRVPRPAGLAPGAERGGDRLDRQDRSRPRLRDRARLALPPEELLLSGHAEGLPDQPVRPARVHRRPPRDRARWDETPDRHHARAHGGGHGSTTHAGASGRIGQAEYALVDYNRAGCRSSRSSSSLDLRSPEEARVLRGAPLDRRGDRRVRRPDGGGVAAVRREHLDTARARTRSERRSRSRTSTRSASLERALKFEDSSGPRSRRRGARPGDAALRRGQGHDAHARCGRRRRRSTTGTSLSPTCRRSPRMATVEELRAGLPELPAASPRAVRGRPRRHGIRPASSRTPARPRRSSRPWPSARSPPRPRTGSPRTSPAC